MLEYVLEMVHNMGDQGQQLNYVSHAKAQGGTEDAQ